MRKTRLQIAQKDIFTHFDKLSQKVFKRSEIDNEIASNREFWRLATHTPGLQFIDFLIKSDRLREVRFSFPQRTEIRYVWGDASDYEIIQSLRVNSYFTHFTALSLHGLTSQIPKTIYLNFEQSISGNDNPQLNQRGIDLAFRNACRVSKTITQFGDSRVTILNGRHTAQMGVIDLQRANNLSSIRVTDLERTMIDCTVRPIYAGGIHTVLEAYRQVASRLSVNGLAAMLRTLKYTYPYYQAIGFYLDRAGVYTKEQLQIIDKFEKKFDFYLDYRMKEKEYSTRWKLFYPKGL